MSKKIAGVSIPPELPADFSKVASLIRKLDPIKYGFDSSGNYLHWNDFQYRSKEFKGDQKGYAWHALKIRRGLNDISLVDENGNPFQLSAASLDAKLFHIDKQLKLEDLPLSAQDKKAHLVKSVKMEEAISSAQLEGAATTRKVAKEMLETEREPKDDSERMIINNWRLIMMADELKDVELTPELIGGFNGIATDGVLENEHVAGHYRTDAVMVRDVATGDIIHEAPEHEHVLKLIEQLCDFANTDHTTSTNFINPIVKACILHFMIGYIHPFMDGNGRTARALFYWFILKHGYENFKYVSISAPLKSAPTKYVRSYVYTETDDNDLTHFVDYQLTVIINAIERFNEYIKSKIEDTREVRELLDDSKLKGVLKLPHIVILAKGLETAGRVFSVKEIQSDFDVSHTAARKYLERLVELKLLFKSKDGNENTYIAPADLKQRLTKA
ncbi:Fic family protein [Vibrio alginolyticus]|uniref:Fic family protein n=1 Tax=Vibrio alginolyticus TaxID=663 RepID=UPI00215D5AB4|nr:Fic family protein [Vibrio alginolyticus]MCR9599924.1 Fic family protein [Vibrio alginolyticus]MCR9605198.1 Fic family protein [Vibrio alginolyticus]